MRALGPGHDAGRVHRGLRLARVGDINRDEICPVTAGACVTQLVFALLADEWRTR